MGYLIIVLGFLFLGWFGAKLIAMGQAGVKSRSLEVGFNDRLQGRVATSAGVVLIVAGLIVIAPFVWGIAVMLINVIRGRF
jgi:hypothetical protein